MRGADRVHRDRHFAPPSFDQALATPGSLGEFCVYEYIVEEMKKIEIEILNNAYEGNRK